MKEKTRLKLAARGMGPLVRPGRPGRGRRGVLAPDRGATVSGAVGDASSGPQPAVCEVRGYGEVLEPPAESVRQRVRLRPVVREALDIEAGRLGMTREALCRIVLEEIARKAVEQPVVAVVDAEDAPVAAAPDVEDAPAIPAGYVGGVGEEEDDAPSAGAGPVQARDVTRPEAAARPGPNAVSPAGRALLRVRRRSAGDGVPVRVVRWGRRRPRFGRRGSLGGAWGAALAFALLAALSIGALAVSWRYEVTGTAADGVYVVDRWRGVVWICGVAARGRPTVCFGQPLVGRELARVVP